MHNLEEERKKPIAFFDSGVGGLTVLSAAVHLLPNENFVYFGDTANAPYGSKPKDEVRRLSVNAAEMLVQRGCKALVVACNTATSAAVDLLREVLLIPVIGMEPALKPALSNGGKILVMATPLTLREEKFRNLCERYVGGWDNIQVLPCPGLVELIEQGQVEGPLVEATLRKLLSGVDLQSLTTVVLGCTHYLFIREALKQILPKKVAFIDGNLGTVRQLQRVLEGAGLLRSKNDAGGHVELTTSGGSLSLPLFHRLYQIAYDKI